MDTGTKNQHISEPSTLVLPPRQKFTNLFSTYKTFTGFFIILILVVAIPLSLTLLSKQQDVRQHASENTEQLVSVDAVTTASNTYSNYFPDNVVNLSDSLWNSGGYAPQWIQLELSQLQIITSIRLKVVQYPSGGTITNIYAGSDTNNLTSVKQFNQNTTNGDELSVSFPTPIPNVKYIKVETTKSPSWVAWGKIKVYGIVDTSHLKYFGYYDVNDADLMVHGQWKDYLGEITKLGNSNIVHVDLRSYYITSVVTGFKDFLIRAKAANQKVIIGIPLDTNWNDEFTAIKNIISPNDTTIWGFEFDEPHSNSTTLFKQATANLRSAYPSFHIMTILTYGDFGIFPNDVFQPGFTQLPSDFLDNVTDAAVDYYIWYPNSKNFLLVYNELLKLANKNQGIWIIPEGYQKKEVEAPPPPGPASEITSALSFYYSLAKINPRVVGILNFIYSPYDPIETGPNIEHFKCSVRGYTLTGDPCFDNNLTTSEISIGKEIISSSSAITPTSIVPSSSSSLTASPNPCQVSSQGTCTTNISWNTQGLSSGSVCVNMNGGSEVLFAGYINGSGTQAAPWITKGNIYNFSLYKNGCGSQKLSSISVTAN